MAKNTWGLVGGGFRKNCFRRIEKPDGPLNPPGVVDGYDKVHRCDLAFTAIWAAGENLMIPKQIENISKSDIESLITNKVREGR